MEGFFSSPCLTFAPLLLIRFRPDSTDDCASSPLAPTACLFPTPLPLLMPLLVPLLLLLLLPLLLAIQLGSNTPVPPPADAIKNIPGSGDESGAGFMEALRLTKPKLLLLPLAPPPLRWLLLPTALQSPRLPLPPLVLLAPPALLLLLPPLPSLLLWVLTPSALLLLFPALLSLPSPPLPVLAPTLLLQLTPALLPLRSLLLPRPRLFMRALMLRSIGLVIQDANFPGLGEERGAVGC